MWRLLFVGLVIAAPGVAAAQSSVVVSGVNTHPQYPFPAGDINGTYAVAKNSGGGISAPRRYSATRTYVGNYRADVCVIITDNTPTDDAGTATVEVRVQLGAGAVGVDGILVFRKTVSKPVNTSGLTISLSGIGNNAIGSAVPYAGAQVRLQ